MAISGDVTACQDGVVSAKMHPYFVALVRWCVSRVWGTATVILHRLMMRSLPPIKGKPLKSRPASSEHLHPEPRVECVVLHQPTHHTIDVIFVHGLYGSLYNTWRQGEWRSKYETGPEKINILRPSNNTEQCYCTFPEDIDTKADYFHKSKNETGYTNIEETFYKDMQKILPNEDVFNTEKFYKNLDQIEIIDNYETQAKFVSDLFRENCDINDNVKAAVFNIEDETNESESSKEYDIEIKCNCLINSERVCTVGCGCICDDCYSFCWPRDWIKEDFPGARVISINYTSDPHLWRPLWVKENKRLHLHERAEQMTQKLLELGVGEKPVIWVGHSKGGLFIKQIYCEAYESYMKLNEQTSEQNNNNNNSSDIWKQCDKENNSNKGIEEESMDMNISDKSAEINEVYQTRQASLYANSRGFMFYSVPHRGSPLAAFKTPLTARSVELLEISKDCDSVLDLHRRWLSAAAASQPRVCSVVETRRTLMAVLWLTIVSVDSADPGLGALYGVSVDHREICKPSSRHCLLYTELAGLINAALCTCEYGNNSL